MADYYCSPLWDRDGDPYNINLDTLPISSQLKRDLDEWAGRYDANFNDDHTLIGFASPKDRIKFVEDGRELWTQLQVELGSDYTVAFFDDIQQQLLEFPSGI